ncbi:hypothetical protein WME90_30055 [Sorangium sp. So ce375]|uniref:hypothetical protein n=1 Tax=Sorangium sp. So ce375 TaxID=3133306 RepID=UPI003F5C7635
MRPDNPFEPNPLSWAEVKRLISRIVGPRLADLGFNNPGRAMWRFRPYFVDVVWFRCHRAGIFHVEFGCGLRRAVRNNPAPRDCQFRTQPGHSFGWEETFWSFRPSESEQVEVLRLLAPRVAAAAARWFSHFDTIDSAISALENNQWSGPRNVADCAPGSPAYREVMSELRDAAARVVQQPAAADEAGAAHRRRC